MANKTKTPVLENVLLAVFVSVLVLLVLSQANPLTNYPSRDGGVFNYIGSLILDGKLPYLDAWDNKPIGIYYLNAFGLWLGKGTRWGIWIVEYIFLFFSSWLGYKLFSKVWQPGVAIFATIAWLWSLSRVLMGGNYTEEYPLLFNFFALFLFILSIEGPEKKVYDLIIGVSLALSLLFRPNNIGIQISIILTWIIIMVIQKEYSRYCKKILWAVIGASAVLLGVFVFLWSKGILYAMFEAAILYNFSYNKSTIGVTFLSASIFHGFENFSIIAWISLIGYVLAILALIKQIRMKQIGTLAVFLVIGWPVEIILSGLSKRGYGHYFISWLPVMAVLNALALSNLFPQIFAQPLVKFINQKIRLVLPALVGLLVIVYWNSFVVYKDSFEKILFHRSFGVEIIPPIANYVRENTEAGDKVLFWGGQAGLNFASRRESPTAYLSYPEYVDSVIEPKLAYGFYSDITSNPPILIIDAYIDDPDNLPSLSADTRQEQKSIGKGQTFHPDYLEKVFSFIENNYKLETVINNYGVYRYIKKP